MSAPSQEQDTDNDDGNNRGVNNIPKFRKQLDEEYEALTNQETVLQRALRQLEYEEDCLKNGIEAATGTATATTKTTTATAATISTRRQRFQPSATASEHPSPTTTTRQRARALQEQADARLEQALEMHLGDSSSSEDDSEDE